MDNAIDTSAPIPSTSTLRSESAPAEDGVVRPAIPRYYSQLKKAHKERIVPELLETDLEESFVRGACLTLNGRGAESRVLNVLFIDLHLTLSGHALERVTMNARNLSTLPRASFPNCHERCCISSALIVCRERAWWPVDKQDREQRATTAQTDRDPCCLPGDEISRAESQDCEEIDGREGKSLCPRLVMGANSGATECYPHAMNPAIWKRGDSLTSFKTLVCRNNSCRKRAKLSASEGVRRKRRRRRRNKQLIRIPRRKRDRKSVV